MAKTWLQDEREERYDPVPHTKEDTTRLLSNPKVKTAYDALGPKYEALDSLLRSRREAGLTQAQIAERMSTTASAIARLEGSLISGKHSPTFDTLLRYAEACGKRLRIVLE